MTDRLKKTFLNHVRSLFNIDGYLLPELDGEQQQKFVRDPVRYFIGGDEPQSDAIWREVLKRQSREEVTLEFIDKSAKAAIKALRGLEQTAIMLETYAPELFPETTEVNGVIQKHFGRVIMESAAQSIRESWAEAVGSIAGKKVEKP